MKTFTLLYLPFLLLTLLIGCKEEEDDPFPSGTELLKNPSAESGSDDWLNREAQYFLEWTDEEAADGNGSLKIRSDQQVDDFGYWVQGITEIPKGKRLQLSTKIKTNEVDGEGVFIVIRTDSSLNNDQLQFYTTQNNLFIGGTQDWTEYSLEMDEEVKEEVEIIYVFLIFGRQTTGTAYFDDVSLKVID